MPRGSEIALEASSLLQQASETLRWCRFHFRDRAAAAKLRELQVVLTVVALALDYEMDGEPEKAAQALERAGAAYEAIRLSDPIWDPSLVDPGH